MKLDRNLILIAVIFLILQLVWLAHELQFIQIPLLGSKDQNQNSWVVGKIIRVHNNVRRRPISEIIWNEGKETEQVNAYDALLTLKNSAMKVQLTNGAELNLSENTLVYLEPIANDSNDQRIRIRFSHGSLRSKMNLNPTDFQSESWIISPQSGSEFQLKSFENGQVEIEMSKGSLAAEVEGKRYTVSQGEVATVDGDKKIAKKSMLKNLVWRTGQRDYKRLYAHRFPIHLPLDWEGPAQKLILYQNGKITQQFEILATQNNKTISFMPGSYEVRLENDNGISNWLHLDLWNAPVIHLMSPLPRDRYQIGEMLNYIWLNPKNVRTYTWKMSEQNPSEFNNSEFQKTVREDTQIIFSNEKSGNYQWKVLGFDADGYEIPEPYSYSIYFTEAPLEAPDLNVPEIKKIEIRSPAHQYQNKINKNKINKKKQLPSSSGLIRLFEIFTYSEIAQAEDAENKHEKVILKLKKKSAEENQLQESQNENTSDKKDGGDSLLQQALSGDRAPQFDQNKQNLIFSWGLVSRAEFYILEISETPDFRNPILEKKLNANRYEWSPKDVKTKNFFWRVASGSKVQMGRFSKLQEVNFNKLNEGHHYAGLMISSPADQNLDSKNIAASTESTLANDGTEIEEHKESPGEEGLIIRGTEKLISLSFNFENSSYTDSAGAGFRYSGPTTKFRYSLDGNFDGEYRAGASVVVQSNTWKNVDQDSIMQNKNYYESRSRFMGWLGKKKSPWTFSGGFGYHDLPARSGLETTRFDSSILLNLGVWYDFVGRYYFRGKMGLIFSSGASLSDTSIAYHGYRLWGQYKEINYYWGPDCEISSIRSNSGTTGLRYQLGLLLGIVW